MLRTDEVLIIGSDVGFVEGSGMVGNGISGAKDHAGEREEDEDEDGKGGEDVSYHGGDNVCGGQVIVGACRGSCQVARVARSAFASGRARFENDHLAYVITQGTRT